MSGAISIVAAAVTSITVGMVAGTAATVVAGVLVGAAGGAALGAATSAITGGDIGKGAMMGAMTGAVTGGVAEYFSPAVTSLGGVVDNSVAGASASMTDLGAQTGITGAANTTGITGSALAGGDVSGTIGTGFTGSGNDITGLVGSLSNSTGGYSPGLASDFSSLQAGGSPISGSISDPSIALNGESINPSGTSSLISAGAPNSNVAASNLAVGNPSSAIQTAASPENLITGAANATPATGALSRGMSLGGADPSSSWFGANGIINQNKPAFELGGKALFGLGEGVLQNNAQTDANANILKAYQQLGDNAQSLQQAKFANAAANYAPSGSANPSGLLTYTPTFDPNAAASPTSTFTPSANGGQWVYSPSQGKVIYQINKAGA